MRSQNKIIFFVLVHVFLLLSSCDVQVTKYNTDAEIRRLMIENDLPSISTCVIKDNSIVWQRVYGYSNRETRIEATYETIYHIGSVSKLFIVTAFMQLVEQDIVNINHDINEYLPIAVRNPNFPDVPITAKMLLTHSSSLAATKFDADAPGIWQKFREDQAPPLSAWIPQFILPSGKYFSPEIWKSYAPDQFELYSNIGSCLLAYIVEYLTGQDFRDYCKENIFSPLGMHNTSFYYGDLDTNKMAVLYQYNNVVHPFFDFRLHASGAAKTTIDDLSRFIMAYMNGGELDGQRILKASTVSDILTIQNKMSGLCFIWNASYGDWFGHSGNLGAGANAIVEVHAQSKVAFIIFGNKSPSHIEQGKDIYGLVRQKANEYIK